MVKVSIVVGLFALTLVPALSVLAQGGEVPFETLFDPDQQPAVPSRLLWSPQGDRLAYYWDLEGAEGEEATDSQDETTGLWIETPAKQERRLALRPSQRPQRSIWLPDGSGMLLHQASGLAHLDLGGAGEGKLRTFVATGEDDEDFKLSPDGESVSFVRHADLWTLDLESGRAQRHTRDGKEGEILNGKTDWVYWEELWGRSSTGHWWSPDNRRLAFYRFDDRLVPTYPLVDFTQIPYPTVEQQRYPKAGERNPEVKVGILTVHPEKAAAGAEENPAHKEVVWLKTDGAEETYLARVHWLPDGKRVAVERLNREQNRLDLLVCDADTGDCEVLLTEANDTWVRVGNFTRFLEDGSFLWASQREGWNHLYLVSAEGEILHRLTPEGRNVLSLAALNEREGWLVYSAFATGGLGATGRLVERVPLRGDAVGTPTGWTAAQGFHGATVAEASGHWVHSYHDAHTPRTLTVKSADGETLVELPAKDPGKALRKDLPQWEFLTIPGPDGPLPARLLKPAGLEDGKTYPAIVYHYGCPESQVVQDAWSGRDLWHRWMASRGYGVFMVDNGQSNHFGKAGVDRAHRRFGTLNLEAQLAGVEYLRSLGWVDTDRLGLWGWSGGGANTLYVLTNAPGTFRAGVSGAPVTHWRLYDTLWTERYLDHPEDNAEGYEASSPITYADRLEDHLLIVHGTADDNVHPQNTLAFIDRLVQADIPFEDAIYPRQKHGFRGAVMNHFYRRMTAFYDRHLQP